MVGGGAGGEGGAGGRLASRCIRRSGRICDLRSGVACVSEHKPEGRKRLGTDIKTYSAAVAHIELLGDQDKRLGVATAFFYRYDERPFLVTNWHNIMGRDPATGQPRADDCEVPLKVRVRTQAALTGLTFAYGAERAVVVPAPADPSGSAWVMHPDGQKIDIAALEFDKALSIHCLNDDTMDDPYVEVGQDVYILGYPRGLMPTKLLPIWKKGSIATEPAVLPNGEPYVLIDAATREGMSGSPVVTRTVDRDTAAELRKPFSVSTPIIVQKGHGFIGVYSGRMGLADALEAQLGKVWLGVCIDEMLAAPRPADWESIR